MQDLAPQELDVEGLHARQGIQRRTLRSGLPSRRGALRLYPPAWALARVAVRDCSLLGTPIRAGTAVLFSQWVLHRDPRFFAEPERFDPERWMDDRTARLPRGAYFLFGAGPRLCIGNTFALMQATLLLATIARRFRLEPSPGAPPVRPRPDVVLRPEPGVWMIPRPR